MSQGGQTLLLVPLLVAALAYVGRSIYRSVRPKAGCGTCQHNQKRVDDYA